MGDLPPNPHNKTEGKQKCVMEVPWVAGVSSTSPTVTWLRQLKPIRVLHDSGDKLFPVGKGQLRVTRDP